jgi:hypothetical protein
MIACCLQRWCLCSVVTWRGHSSLLSAVCAVQCCTCYCLGMTYETRHTLVLTHPGVFLLQVLEWAKAGRLPLPSSTTFAGAKQRYAAHLSPLGLSSFQESIARLGLQQWFKDGMLDHAKENQHAAAAWSYSCSHLASSISLDGDLLFSLLNCSWCCMHFSRRCCPTRTAADAGLYPSCKLTRAPACCLLCCCECYQGLLRCFCCGAAQALWVSVSTDLVVDARRDLEALGMLQYEAVKLHVSPVKHNPSVTQLLQTYPILGA